MSAENVSFERYQWLVGSEGTRALEKIHDLPTDPLRAASQLRREFQDWQTHLLLEQRELRQRARDKFSAAAQMFFTPRSLEQATDESIARYKAHRLSAVGIAIDLCCGIGGDLLAAAGADEIIAVDRDPVMTCLARANGAVLLPDAKMRTLMEAVALEQLAGATSWLLDPDRRPHDRRTTQVELHEPGADFMEQLLALPVRGGLKLAPAAEVPSEWEQRHHLEWISRDRQCRQLVVWSEPVGLPPNVRTATRVSGADAVSFQGAASLPLPRNEQIKRFIIEPDPAILAAKLTAAFAESEGLAAVGEVDGYLTADHAPSSPLAASFEILAVLPLQRRKLAEALRQRGIGRVEVKKRGLELDPAGWQQQLRGSGDEAGVVLVFPCQGKPVAVVAQRHEKEG